MMNHLINVTTIEAMLIISCLDGRTPQNEIDQKMAERVRRDIEDVVIGNINSEEE